MSSIKFTNNTIILPHDYEFDENDGKHLNVSINFNKPEIGSKGMTKYPMKITYKNQPLNNISYRTNGENVGIMKNDDMNPSVMIYTTEHLKFMKVIDQLIYDLVEKNVDIHKKKDTYLFRTEPGTDDEGKEFRPNMMVSLPPLSKTTGLITNMFHNIKNDSKPVLSAESLSEEDFKNYVSIQDEHNKNNRFKTSFIKDFYGKKIDGKLKVPETYADIEFERKYKIFHQDTFVDEIKNGYAFYAVTINIAKYIMHLKNYSKFKYGAYFVSAAVKPKTNAASIALATYADIDDEGEEQYEGIDIN